MAYHEWPIEYNERTFKWSVINSDVLKYQWASVVIQQVSREENLNTEYLEYGDPYLILKHAAQTDYRNVKRCLENMGYKVPYDFQSCNQAKLNATLSQNLPILARGKGVNPENINEDVRHMWLIDGYLMIKKLGVAGNWVSDPDWPLMYHCVWGWSNSLANGYFAWGNSIGGMPLCTDSQDPELPDPDAPNYDEIKKNEYVFDSELMFMLLVKPNK